MARKPKISRGLQDRRRIAAVIHRFLEAHWPRVIELRAELFGELLREGETLPDGELELALWLRRLDKVLEDAATGEELYRRGLIVLGKHQRQRDQGVSELRLQMGGMRRFVDMALGAGSATQLLRFDGRTRRRHEALEAQAGGVLVRVEALEAVEPILKGMPADPEQWAGMIRGPLAALRKSNSQATLQENKVEGLLIGKKRAFATFDLTARGLVRRVVGELQAVGEKELAKRLRQMTRRRKRPGPKKRPKATSRSARRSAAAGEAGGSTGEAKAES